ncbi:MAG: glycosyltransferase, partial [Nitrososphaerota archaeon]
MVIGFDASRAFDAAPTGTENYSYYLLKSLVEVDLVNKYRIYLRSKLSQVGSKLGELPANFELVEIKQRRLWTQVGLAWECFTNPPDLLFIPAHTLPVFRKSSLKTVVTIHDIGAEFLPQYHTYPSKIYLNMSTTYAVRNADRIIAVSKSTRKDLIEKVGANPAKVEV